MSKAEERALERFPVHEGASKEWIEVHLKGVCAEYIEGYKQAEKDLELGWEDIKEICDIAFVEACRLERNLKGSLIYKEQHYQEVLKRFKDLKK